MTVDSIDVVNPSCGTVLRSVPTSSPTDLNASIAAGRAALPDWSADETARRAALRCVAQVLLDHVSELARSIAEEQGKTLTEAALEVGGAVRWFQYYADLPIPAEVVRDTRSLHVQVQRRPMGVVAAITPGNYPLLIAAWKLAPALLAGNAVVVKPSPACPLTAIRLLELLGEVLPPGVASIAIGGGDVGEHLVSHAGVDCVSLTGSPETGRRVAEVAGRGLKPVTLELGGNDPAVVMDDIDPSEIASRIFWAAMHNNGQVCAAIKRVFVPEAALSSWVDALADIAKSARVGRSLDPDTQLGPLGSRRGLERLQAMVDEADREGATIIKGHAPTVGDGFFYPPTIVVDPDPDAAIVNQEQSGPALPVIPYADEESLIRLINASPMGLTASVWSDDHERATLVAQRIECGTAWVNTHLVLLPDQPFGGVKGSGIGTENGPWGLEFYHRPRVLHVDRSW